MTGAIERADDWLGVVTTLRIGLAFLFDVVD